MFDVVVVGGGTAGLSAALVLGRARHRVLICTDGPPRNAPTPEAHNLFTRDGEDPFELLRIGRSQLYPSVEVREEPVQEIRPGFEVVFPSGSVSARRIVLATGLTDELPPIEGFAERFGKTVLHCPYCHGWEVRERALAVYGNGASAEEVYRLALGWSSRVTLLTDGPSNTDIPAREERIFRLQGDADVVFETGEVLSFEALFVRPIRRQRSPLAAQLGCVMTENGIVQVDENGQTSVPGVYAAGDMIEPMWQILPAASFTGARAGIGVSRDLLLG